MIEGGFIPGVYPIDSYGNGGFRFADMSHRGSILALPSGIHALQLEAGEPFTEAAIDALWQEPQGAVELLLLGTGASLVPPPEALRWALRSRGISVEPMPTGAAARTYNILLGEKRRVAAALMAVA